MELNGSIIEIKARQYVSGDTVQTIKLEVHGDFALLHQLMRKPIKINLQEMEEK